MSALLLAGTVLSTLSSMLPNDQKTKNTLSWNPGNRYAGYRGAGVGTTSVKGQYKYEEPGTVKKITGLLGNALSFTDTAKGMMDSGIGKTNTDTANPEIPKIEDAPINPTNTIDPVIPAKEQPLVQAEKTISPQAFGYNPKELKVIPMNYNDPAYVTNRRTQLEASARRIHKDKFHPNMVEAALMQARLESGSTGSGLYYASNNPYGLTTNDKSKSYYAQDVGGKYLNFQVFDSIEQADDEYFSRFLPDRVFGGKVGWDKPIEGVFRDIGKSGYAEDPMYADKLIRGYSSYRPQEVKRSLLNMSIGSPMGY